MINFLKNIFKKKEPKNKIVYRARRINRVTGEVRLFVYDDDFDVLKRTFLPACISTKEELIAELNKMGENSDGAYHYDYELIS